jgi:hypothetical protein
MQWWLLLLFLPCAQTTGYYYVSNGGFSDMCQIGCNSGYFYSGGQCLPEVYVVQFQVAIALPPASTFNVRVYIASVANLSGISGCSYTPRTITPNVLYVTNCTTPPAVIRATVDTGSTVITTDVQQRRLLTVVGTADVTTEIKIQSDPIKASTAQAAITTTSINSELGKNSLGSTSTAVAPTLVVLQITHFFATCNHFFATWHHKPSNHFFATWHHNPSNHFFATWHHNSCSNHWHYQVQYNHY